MYVQIFDISKQVKKFRLGYAVNNTEEAGFLFSDSGKELVLADSLKLAMPLQGG